jgi:BMFP domain-containing protein YqiC
MNNDTLTIIGLIVSSISLVIAIISVIWSSNLDRRNNKYQKYYDKQIEVYAKMFEILLKLRESFNLELVIESEGGDNRITKALYGKVASQTTYIENKRKIMDSINEINHYFATNLPFFSENVEKELHTLTQTLSVVGAVRLSPETKENREEEFEKIFESVKPLIYSISKEIKQKIKEAEK